MAVKRSYFSPRIERIRKHLDKAAQEAAKSLSKTIQKQAEQGKSDAAIWVLEHYEQEGQRVIAPSVDKQLDSGPTGPTINIGFLGSNAQASLPASTPQIIGAKVSEVDPERKGED